MQEGRRESKGTVGGSVPDPTVRERVLTAFADLVAERGLAATSIDDIASLAGVSKTTLYTRWPERRALVSDGFRFVAQRVPSTDHDMTFRETFDAIITQTTTDQVDPRFYNVFAESIAAGGVDPEIRAVVHANHHAWRLAIQDMIERGKRDGEVPADRDVAVAAEVAMGVVTMRHLIGDLPIDEDLRKLVWTLITSPTPY